MLGCCNHTWAAHSTEVAAPHRCHEKAGSAHKAHDSHCHDRTDGLPPIDDEESPCCETINANDRANPTDDEHSCQHASCAWLTIAGQTITPVDCGGPFDLATSEAINVAVQAAHISSAQADAGPLDSLPLRLHLMVGVLLI
jgi:hypothetical protein